MPALKKDRESEVCRCCIFSEDLVLISGKSDRRRRRRNRARETISGKTWRGYKLRVTAYKGSTTFPSISVYLFSYVILEN